MRAFCRVFMPFNKVAHDGTTGKNGEKSMIGIECDFDGTLKEFLNNIPIYLYDWYISEEEIICEGNNVYLPEYIKGNNLEKYLLNQKNMILFMNLQAYPNGTGKSRLKTYRDFVCSPCQLILLVSDKTCWEVYAKSQKILGQIILNLTLSGYDNYTIKTVDSDCRSIMSVT